MPPTVEEMEKMCGLSVDEVMNITKNNETPLEKEAGEIWKHLDHLAATDPVEYKRYVDQQIKEGEEYFKNGGEGLKQPKVYVPKAVFWVETEVLDSSDRPTGIPRYFNVCESESIEYTDDKNLNIFMSDLDNRQVDCVIHPTFMKKCTSDNLFLHDTIQLLFQTYAAEHKEKEKVRMQYRHHPEGRKLVMKMPKLPGEGKDNKGDSAMDVLSKVRHHKEAQKMMEDDRAETTKRLFDLYREKPAEEKTPAPDPETTYKKPEIVELAPALQHTTVTTADGTATTTRVHLPPSADPSQVDVELEEDTTLLVTVPAAQPLAIPLPSKAVDYSAKYIKTKHLLKISITHDA
eukprot:TRINITY_DN1272_c2_g1_i1.p1 TRINITY_DN1272_c2_g1~~TRINITY_DN1272_c2_g1_i1.p1  ORF type:complete len:358 (+),score=131.64 TRINITY_DN1272_c2_g1_i1:34-1074(+)